MADVHIFARTHFQGRLLVLPKGRYDGARRQILIGEEMLRSLLVPKGLVVRLYEHCHFQGRFIDIRSDVPALTQFWNERTSSIIVYGAAEPPPVILEVMIFERVNYRGAFQLLSVGKYDAIQMGSGNMIVNSALVPYGLAIKLFALPHFQGENITFYDDTPELSLKWNTHVTSIIVEKSSVGLGHIANGKKN